jgi:hypothetical protein
MDEIKMQAEPQQPQEPVAVPQEPMIAPEQPVEPMNVPAQEPVQEAPASNEPVSNGQ